MSAMRDRVSAADGQARASDTRPILRNASKTPPLKRIKALAVPPASTDIWICLKANGHIQATGCDARGRKQYRYHARFREVRESTKYHQSYGLTTLKNRHVQIEGSALKFNLEAQRPRPADRQVNEFPPCSLPPTPPDTSRVACVLYPSRCLPDPLVRSELPSGTH
jgi:hypothetical protein